MPSRVSAGSGHVAPARVRVLLVCLGGLAVVLLLLPLAARAAPAPPPSLCVNVGGTAGCFASINSAILAAIPGTHIAVWSGTYHEHITMTEGIVVEGVDWAQTIIDGDFAAPRPVVYFPPGLTAATVLSGVQVTHGGTGTPSQGGCGIGIEYSAPRIVNTWVNSNTGMYGGGVKVNSGAPVFDNVAVWNNLASYGGGLSLMNGAVVTMTGDPFEGFNGTIALNRALLDGGGMQIGGNVTATLAGLRFWFNEAMYGGGAYISNNNSSVQLALNQFVNNTASSMGGGLRAELVSNLEVFLNWFEHNGAANGGGGAYLGSTQGRLENNWFISNSVTLGPGGGVEAYNGTEALLLHGNWFERNSASNGGGLSVSGAGSRLLVDANVLVSNTASLGGGVYLYAASTLTLSNNIIARNISTAPGKMGGIQVYQTPARLINNTIADNNGSGVSFIQSNGVVIVNNIVAGNSASGIERFNSDTAVFTADFNDVLANTLGNYSGLPAGAHDLAVPPLFVAAGPDLAAFYHLQAASPVSRTGSVIWAPLRDYDGELRLLGTSMGADHVSVPLLHQFLPLIRR